MSTFSTVFITNRMTTAITQIEWAHGLMEAAGSSDDWIRDQTGYLSEEWGVE